MLYYIYIYIYINVYVFNAYVYNDNSMTIYRRRWGGLGGGVGGVGIGLSHTLENTIVHSRTNTRKLIYVLYIPALKYTLTYINNTYWYTHCYKCTTYEV